MSAPKLGSSPSQKSWREDWEGGVVWAEDPVGCALEFGLVCCANAGSASAVDKNSVMNMRLFIIFFLFRERGALESSTPT